MAGPIAALVLNCGLERRFRSGLAVALGSAMPEAAYAFLAFWGTATFLGDYPWIGQVARASGGAVLLVLGVLFLRRSAPPGAAREERRRAREGWGSFALGFSLTAFNPTLIATWTAAVAIVSGFGVDLGTQNPGLSGLAFALAAAVGIVTWFATMLWIIYRMHERFRPETLVSMRRGVGVFLLVVSAWFFADLAFALAT
ncbi:MAG: LysE family transporter [Myxococcales bacterium]|nr:LysE family transporter [Myxococcales bacterium]